MSFPAGSANNKGSYETMDFCNIPGKGVPDFYEEISRLVENHYLVVTAVDGSIDDYLQELLTRENVLFEFLHEVCLVHPESSKKFVECIQKIPESAFFCCWEKPALHIMEKLKPGYVEEFGKVAKNESYKYLFEKMNLLASDSYISQGSCHLFVAILKKFPIYGQL